MKDANKLTRRKALLGLGAAIAAAPLLQLLGCEAGDDSMNVDLDEGDDAGTGAGANDAGTGAGANDAASAHDATSSGSSDADTSTTDASLLTSWATGGVAAMTARAAYPNPFANGAGTSCALTCEATIGPCHTTSPMRTDVSNGWDGLPMRIALRVVDEGCSPVAGALVEIWHTNYKGIYSGRISTMCNTEEVDRADNYFRGYLKTDADGRVDFDSVFPGWYSGRAVHIHLRVLKGDYQGGDNAESWVITQLLWDDALVTRIFAEQPLYKDYGTPNTLLSADNVVGGETDHSKVTWDVARMTDGAMMVSKTLVLRSALTAASCSLAGGGTMGGSGGPGAMGAPP